MNVEEFKKLFTKWGVYTYSKLLSEQIFEPLDEKDNKSLMYAPFQTMAQYYISLGYAGIIYGSTVLLTAILREDHFSNGSFEYRQRAGQVDEILKRMVAELNK